MPIAGFDPSLAHFGWVIMDENKTGQGALLDYGTFATKPSDGLLVQRLIYQRERARKLLTDFNVSFVSMEAPYWQDFSTELLFALNQYLHNIFLDLGIQVIYIQPLTLKKMALPDMNPQEVTKHHMVHAAKTELSKHGKRFSEHVSDAYFAGKIGCRFYKWFFLKKLKDEDLTSEEHHTFCGKHTYVRGVKKGLTDYTGIIYKLNDQFYDYSKISKKSIDITKELNNG